MNLTPDRIGRAVQARLDDLAIAYEVAIAARHADPADSMKQAALDRAERVLLSQLSLVARHRADAHADGERWRWRVSWITEDLIPERRPERRRG